MNESLENVNLFQVPVSQSENNLGNLGSNLFGSNNLFRLGGTPQDQDSSSNNGNLFDQLEDGENQQSDGISNIIGDLMNILLQNPEFREMAEQNPEQFQAMVTSPQFLGMLMGLASTPQQSTVDLGLSEEDEQNINELTQLGVSYDEAVQYYIAGDRNKNTAANLIFQDMDTQ